MPLWIVPAPRPRGAKCSTSSPRFVSSGVCGWRWRTSPQSWRSIDIAVTDAVSPTSAARARTPCITGDDATSERGSMPFRS